MDFTQLGQDLLSAIPTILFGIVLIIIAWALAKVVKKAVVKAASAAGLQDKLVSWNVADSNESATNTIESIAQVLYYLVWVFFLPGIFDTFGLQSIADPIRNMTDTVLQFIPKLFIAGIIFAIGFFVARIVKQLAVNLATTVNVDRYVNKFTGSKSSGHKTPVANALGNVVFALVIIPIAIVGLEALGIESITNPIIELLNTVLSVIPNILVAVILVAVGMVISKVVGQLVTSLLDGTGINELSKYVEEKGSTKPVDFAKIIGQVVSVVIGLFFTVEALNALNLDVLNTVGSALIAYIPNVLIALIILGLGIFGGRFVGNFIAENTHSKWIAEIVKAIFAVFAVFMALEQLDFASSIVNTAFLFIIGGLAVAFALSFGLGGRDFARKQLDKLDHKIDSESDDKMTR